MSQQVPEGRTALRINIDETSISLYQGDCKGAVLFGKRRRRRGAEPVQRVKKALKRTCVTHIAFICDRADLQPLMPQVVIGNCSTLQAGAWAGLLAACPANVYLVRQKSAWNNAGLFARVLGVLGQILRPFLCEVQPIVLWDACRLHLHRDVLQACVDQVLWVVAIPAGLTWLLQPCDTHAFQSYKRALRAAYLRQRAASADGQVSVPDFLLAVYDAIRQHLQGQRWDRSFEEDGFGCGQARVSKFVRQQLALQGPVEVARGLPSPAELALCFPKRARVDVAMLLRPYQQLALPAPKQLALPAPKARGRLLLRRRPQTQGAASSNGAPGPSAQAAAALPVAGAGVGPVTRSQTRGLLRAALAKGRPLPVPGRLVAARGPSSALHVQGPHMKHRGAGGS